LKAIKSSNGTIVPEASILELYGLDKGTRVYLNGSTFGESESFGGMTEDFTETPDELARLLGWEVVNEAKNG
jgi:hypothetical protein